MQNCGRGESDAEDKTGDSSGTRKAQKQERMREREIESMWAIQWERGK